MAQKYSEEFKEGVLKRMMAPNPVPVMEICRETGVSDVTLYKWRKALLDKGLDVGKKPPDSFCLRLKFYYFWQRDGNTYTVFC